MFLRYDLSRGQVEDVNEAITLHREALRLFSAPHSDRSSSLNNLATALHARFEKTGQIKDVDEAIVLYRKAFGLRLYHIVKDPNHSTTLPMFLSQIWNRQARRKNLMRQLNCTEKPLSCFLHHILIDCNVSLSSWAKLRNTSVYW